MQHWAKVNSLVSSKVSSKVNLETGVSRKQSTPNVPKNKHSPPYTHIYVCVSGCKKCSFFGKFGVLCFPETLVLRSAFLP